MKEFIRLLEDKTPHVTIVFCIFDSSQERKDKIKKKKQATSCLIL